jgi:succinate dehydrogenase/fumarate reductase flavoprotein subunit
MNENVFLTYDAIVIGTGAAGYNAAIQIAKSGKKRVAMVTEGVHSGTSRNTGSDKQTYYKLGLGGNAEDSVRKMAGDLFAGGAVDGDNALCEAALSARCFFQLCELGVPFPANRYGEFVGYKTDHDPYARATSAGPLTSRYMTEALEKEAKRLAIPVYDGLLAVEVLKNADGVCGLLCLEKHSGNFHVFRAPHVVLATGGPAGIYADSVYPVGHTGATSLGLLAGAAFQNLTYWQYGLASVAPRWNVSGTYMQVLPRFVSVDEEGQEREFLLDFFTDPYDALNHVFLKGYQWPFDSRKVLEGSSVIDLLVYRERIELGRKVYLDFRTNPFGLENLDFDRLSAEASAYLRNAEACFGDPIDRLLHMNQPAYELYRSKGVDLKTEMLEIALCAQHCNGGIAVDLWWQTTVPGLFAVGECAGTHGVSRPGGSALNAGQVGALRAAQWISRSDRCPCDAFADVAKEALLRNSAVVSAALAGTEDTEALLSDARREMSACGAAIRDPVAMEKTLRSVKGRLDDLSNAGVMKIDEVYRVYQYRDALVCQKAMLSAMLDFEKQVGVTVGSALCHDAGGDLRAGLPEKFRFTQGAVPNAIQQGVFSGEDCRFTWRPCRPVPEENEAFETVWRRYREDENIF